MLMLPFEGIVDDLAQETRHGVLGDRGLVVSAVVCPVKEHLHDYRALYHAADF
jgi:hypothetical protein